MFGGSANLGTLVAVMRMDTTAVKQAELQLTAFGAHVNKVMLGVGSAMAAVFTVRAVTNMAKGFMNTAVEMEKYRTSLVATIKDVDKANEAFHRMYEWAAANPVDVDEAVASFVRLKTAAVKNSEEMVKVLADAALVMHQPVTVAANAVISTNAQMLRKLGVQVDRTGKQAIVRSGNFRVAVTKDIDSIRAAILDALKHQFGGAMKEFGDTWSGALKTIRGQYQIFQSDVMGSAGDGGPFDTLRKMIVRIREEWIRWRASSDYTAAVKGIQAAIVPILEFISNAYVAFSKFSNLVLGQMDKIALVVKVFLGWKVINGIISGVTLALTYFRREVVLVATGTSLIAKLSSAFVELRYAPGIINKISGALTALGLTPGGLLLVAIGGLILLAETMGDLFDTAADRIAKFNKELRTVPLEELRERADAARGLMGGWREEVEIARRNTEKFGLGYGVDVDSLQSTGPFSSKRRIAPIIEDETSIAGTASKVSKYVGYIQKMKDEVKYLGANAKDFLVTLDAWASKLKPLSDDWKLVKDYSMEIRTGLAKDAGQDAVNSMKRLEEQIKLQEEAKESAVQGVAKFWREASYGFQQGLIQGEEYFNMLQTEFNNLKQTVNEEAGGFLNMEDMFNWTDEMRQHFSEIQSIGEHLASLDLTPLTEQLKKGVLTKKEWITQVEILIQKYKDLPAVVRFLNDAIVEVTNTNKTFAQELESAFEGWANSFAGQLNDMLWKSSVTFEEIAVRFAKMITEMIVQIMIVKPLMTWLMGIFGTGGVISGGKSLPLPGGFDPLALGGVVSNGALTKYARGGVVNKPTLFPMAGGMGLMGEAGPEAVMPLKRGKDGKLGVVAEGKDKEEGSTNITININAVDAQSFVQMLKTNKATVQALVVDSLYKNGQVRKAIQGALS